MEDDPGLLLHPDAVAEHQLREPGAVDQLDASGDLLRLRDRAGREGARHQEDPAVALGAHQGTDELLQLGPLHAVSERVPLRLQGDAVEAERGPG